MAPLASLSGARLALAASTVARLPLATLGIGLLAHAARVTGSFAAAGLVAGAYAVATGAGAPVAARLADRRGQTGVLVGTAAATAALLGAEALVPRGAPLALLLALAAGIGLATPPVGACVRAVLPALVADPTAVRSAFAAEAAVAEITWVAGPPFTLGLAALLGPGVALALAGLVALAATVAFAALPASRRFAPALVRAARGALSSAGLRTLVAVLLAVGVLFGALEVAVTASVATPGDATTAAPFLTLWGLGSLVGGVALARRGGGAATPGALVAMLVALAAGHALLVIATGTDVLFGAVLLLAGTAIAPTLAIAFALVDDLAPAGTVTEAFAWLATAEAVGSALGSALAGGLVEGAGTVAALAFAGCAGALAVVIALAGRATLAPVPAGTAAAAGPA